MAYKKCWGRLETMAEFSSAPPTKSAPKVHSYKLNYSQIVDEQIAQLNKLQEQYDRETDPEQKRKLDALVTEQWLRLKGPDGALYNSNRRNPYNKPAPKAGGRRRTHRTRRVKRKGTKAKKSRQSRR